MDSVTFDASEVTAWGSAMAQAPGITKQELTRATNALTAHGVGIAQGKAPVDQGPLRGTIVPKTAVFVGDTVVGSWGTGMVYAATQEYGATIRAKRGKYLVFTGRDGRLVFAEQVTIPAHPYMRPSAEAVRPRMSTAYAAAIRRVFQRIGGAS